MKVVWSIRANKEWKSVALYIYYEFGKKAVENYLEKTKYWERKLMLFPECGGPEPLLSDKQIKYRSLIISKHSKIIYYIKKEVVYISDVWDMRRNPQVLANRIRTK